MLKNYAKIEKRIGILCDLPFDPRLPAFAETDSALGTREQLEGGMKRKNKTHTLVVYMRVFVFLFGSAGIKENSSQNIYITSAFQSASMSFLNGRCRGTSNTEEFSFVAKC